MRRNDVAGWHTCPRASVRRRDRGPMAGDLRLCRPAVGGSMLESRSIPEGRIMSMTERWFHGRLHELSDAECWELLRSTSVGRVGYTDQIGPVILPVNFAVD